MTTTFGGMMQGGRLSGASAKQKRKSPLEGIQENVQRVEKSGVKQALF